MSIIAALGLGKLIGLSLVFIHERICPWKPERYEAKELVGPSVVFFDKSFISNLKV